MMIISINSRLSRAFIFFAIFGMVILTSSCDDITSAKIGKESSWFNFEVVNGNGICDSAYFTISTLELHGRNDLRHLKRYYSQDTIVFRFNNTTQNDLDIDSLWEMLVEDKSYDSLNYYLLSVSTWSNGVIKTPSNTRIQCGLKLDLGVRYALIDQYLVLDLNAPLSMRKAGWNPNTIYDIDVSRFRFLRTDRVGAVEGRIENQDALPICYAIQGTDTIAAVAANRQTGYFALDYLLSGTYSIGIVDTLDRSYRLDNVPVTIGSRFNMGGIKLR